MLIVDEQPALLQRLYLINSKIHAQISPHLSHSLDTFLTHSITCVPSENEKSAIDDFNDTLEQYLLSRQIPSEGFINALNKCPILQQADHSSLVLERESFLNNLLFSKALLNNNINHGISLQCSTVSCITSRAPLRGPVFLFDGQRSIPLTNLTKTKLQAASFCTLPKPFQFNSDLARSSAWGKTLEDICNLTYPSIEAAYFAINTKLLKTLRKSLGVNILFLDEYFTNELMCRHLSMRDSLISRMVFEPDVRDIILSEKQKFVNSTSNLTLGHDLTDFFYFNDGHRLHRVILSGGSDVITLRKRADHKIITTTHRQHLIRILKSGDLFCDRFLGYTLRCLASGIKALGGSSQQDSIDHYLTILMNANRLKNFMSSQEISLYTRPNKTQIGGAALVELTMQKDYISGRYLLDGDIESYIKMLTGKTLKQSIGKMQCMSYLIDRTSNRPDNVEKL